MTKLYATLTAAALALSLGGFANAAEETTPGGQPSAQQGGGDAAKREQDYLAALKKCEPLAGAERQKCIDDAKKKHGQM
jgi:hypothetical protein